jgi:hypothetical protein
VVKHFSEEAWADFVRDLVAPTVKMAMQQHIDRGCNKCEAALRVWRSVVAIAREENVFTPPGDVVRVSKSQFAPAAPDPKHGPRLLFDSSLQPVTAGVRGSVSARQFLYETDDHYIDLRLEPRAGSDRACVVGQVLNRTRSDRAARELPVRLLGGKLSLAATTTNQFGEFQIEFDSGQNLCLLIGHEDNEIILPLYGVQHKPNNQKDLT